MSTARATERLYRCIRYPSATLTRATIQTYSRGKPTWARFTLFFLNISCIEAYLKSLGMENQTSKNDQQSTKNKCFNLTFGAAPFMHPQALEQWQGHEKIQMEGARRKWSLIKLLVKEDKKCDVDQAILASLKNKRIRGTKSSSQD